MFLVKAAARGLTVFATYAVAGTLLSWICLVVTFRTLWSGGQFGGHGGGIELVLLFMFPQTWATLLFLLGIPALSVGLGHAMGVRAAIKRALSEKTTLLVDWIMRVLWPLSEKLAAQSTAETVHDVASAINRRIEENSTGALRWLLRRVSAVLRLPAILASGEFLDRVRKQPNEARQDLSVRVSDQLRARVEGGSVFGALLIVMGATVLAALLILTVWPYK
jgi:hypothetical protein